MLTFISGFILGILCIPIFYLLTPVIISQYSQRKMFNLCSKKNMELTIRQLDVVRESRNVCTEMAWINVMIQRFYIELQKSFANEFRLKQQIIRKFSYYCKNVDVSEIDIGSEAPYIHNIRFLDSSAKLPGGINDTELLRKSFENCTFLANVSYNGGFMLKMNVDISASLSVSSTMRLHSFRGDVLLRIPANGYSTRLEFAFITDPKFDITIDSGIISKNKLFFQKGVSGLINRITKYTIRKMMVYPNWYYQFLPLVVPSFRNIDYRIERLDIENYEVMSRTITNHLMLYMSMDYKIVKVYKLKRNALDEDSSVYEDEKETMSTSGGKEFIIGDTNSNESLGTLATKEYEVHGIDSKMSFTADRKQRNETRTYGEGVTDVLKNEKLGDMDGSRVSLKKITRKDVESLINKVEADINKVKISNDKRPGDGVNPKYSENVESENVSDSPKGIGNDKGLLKNSNSAGDFDRLDDAESLFVQQTDDAFEQTNFKKEDGICKGHSKLKDEKVMKSEYRKLFIEASEDLTECSTNSSFSDVGLTENNSTSDEGSVKSGVPGERCKQQDHVTGFFPSLNLKLHDLHKSIVFRKNNYYINGKDRITCVHFPLHKEALKSSTYSGNRVFHSLSLQESKIMAQIYDWSIFEKVISSFQRLRLMTKFTPQISIVRLVFDTVDYEFVRIVRQNVLIFQRNDPLIPDFIVFKIVNDLVYIYQYVTIEDYKINSKRIEKLYKLFSMEPLTTLGSESLFKFLRSSNRATKKYLSMAATNKEIRDELIAENQDTKSELVEIFKEIRSEFCAYTGEETSNNENNEGDRCNTLNLIKKKLYSRIPKKELMKILHNDDLRAKMFDENGEIYSVIEESKTIKSLVVESGNNEDDFVFHSYLTDDLIIDMRVDGDRMMFYYHVQELEKSDSQEERSMDNGINEARGVYEPEKSEQELVDGHNRSVHNKNDKLSVAESTVGTDQCNKSDIVTSSYNAEVELTTGRVSNPIYRMHKNTTLDDLSKNLHNLPLNHENNKEDHEETPLGIKNASYGKILIKNNIDKSQEVLNSLGVSLLRNSVSNENENNQQEYPQKNSVKVTKLFNSTNYKDYNSCINLYYNNPTVKFPNYFVEALKLRIRQQDYFNIVDRADKELSTITDTFYKEFYVRSGCIYVEFSTDAEDDMKMSIHSKLQQCKVFDIPKIITSRTARFVIPTHTEDIYTLKLKPKLFTNKVLRYKVVQLNKSFSTEVLIDCVIGLDKKEKLLFPIMGNTDNVIFWEMKNDDKVCGHIEDSNTRVLIRGSGVFRTEECMYWVCYKNTSDNKRCVKVFTGMTLRK